jgi:hypothetical protein
MTMLSYPRAAVFREYGLAAGGLALAAGPLALLGPAPFAAWPLGGAAVIFGAYALATVRRHLTRVSFDNAGLRVLVPWPAHVPWDEARAFRLRHYSTRRDGTHGWMTLTVHGPVARITIQSSIEGFREVAARAAQAAGDNGLTLDRASVQNLRALGLSVPEARP